MRRGTTTLRVGDDDLRINILHFFDTSASGDGAAVLTTADGF